MKKTYMAPAVEITETLAQQMMAVSFKVSETETDEQLVNKENASWNIWED